MSFRNREIAEQKVWMLNVSNSLLLKGPFIIYGRGVGEKMGELVILATAERGVVQ